MRNRNILLTAASVLLIICSAVNIIRLLWLVLAMIPSLTIPATIGYFSLMGIFFGAMLAAGIAGMVVRSISGLRAWGIFFVVVLVVGWFFFLGSAWYFILAILYNVALYLPGQYSRR